MYKTVMRIVAVVVVVVESIKVPYRVHPSCWLSLLCLLGSWMRNTEVSVCLCVCVLDVEASVSCAYIHVYPSSLTLLLFSFIQCHFWYKK